MKQGAKERVLEAGGAIVHRKGFHNTGIQEILKAAEIPKGSFYFYFDSKEDFGLQLIDQYAHLSFARMDDCLNRPDLSPLSKLRLHFRRLFDLLEQNEYTGGCPIGNLSQEMGDLSEPFREKLKGVLEGMRSRIVRCLEDAKREKEIPASLDTHETSEFIISSWQGALMQMKVRRNESPFRAFDKMIFEVILGYQ